jgi:hypothetical protein
VVRKPFFSEPTSVVKMPTSVDQGTDADLATSLLISNIQITLVNECNYSLQQVGAWNRWLKATGPPLTEPNLSLQVLKQVHTDTGISIKSKSGKATKDIAKGDEKKRKGKRKKSDAIYIYKVSSLHYVLLYPIIFLVSGRISSGWQLASLTNATTAEEEAGEERLVGSLLLAPLLPILHAR